MTADTDNDIQEKETPPKSEHETISETPPPATQQQAGSRIWSGLALIISVLVLLLSITGIVGTWIGRPAAIDAVTDVMITVDQVATAGREGIVQADTLLTDVSEIVEVIEEVTTQLSENLAEGGLLLELLPPGTVEDLDTLVEQVRSTLNNLLSIIEAAADFIEAVNEIPFVHVEPPEDVAIVREQVEEILAGIEQLKSDIDEFRVESAADLASVSTTAAQINDRLKTTQQDLEDIDDRLADLQVSANRIKEQFPGWSMTFAVFLTLFLLWVIYAMTRLILIHWAELQKTSGTNNSSAISVTAENEDKSISPSK